MTYSNQEEFETWSQTSSSDLGSIGHSYDDAVQYLIASADRAIDDYCDVPNEFFNAGGQEIVQEYHDGVEVGHYGLLVSFGLSIKRRPYLRLNHSPVLSVTTLEKSDSTGTWTTLTEGRQNDYLVMDAGIRFLRNVPSYDYKNIRATYKAGYTTTPGRIAECSARLAAAMAQRIIDSKSRKNIAISGLSTGTPVEFVGLAKPCFTVELKDLVKRYRRKVPVKLL